MLRTKYCGKFGMSDINANVNACGWVRSCRDMGGVIFVDLRDREGVLQVVFDQRSVDAESFALIEHIKPESVISVSGVIRRRGAETYNPSIPTGEIELAAQSARLISAAKTLPFAMDEKSPREDLRLKYRYLDLRHQHMQDNLRFRAAICRAARQYLDADGFIEIETPMLAKSTPEGAREYLVPSRVHQGEFYALPQSPQVFKQLLMVSGMDRYYQIARCFRDEDLRADRQPEFTQVDMEMSFVEQEDVLAHLERLFVHIFTSVMGSAPKTPFRRITWHEAMDKYGSDKPDLRFDMPIYDITDIAAQSDFAVFKSVASGGGVVRALCVKGGADFSRADIDRLTAMAVGRGAKGMAWILIKPDGEINSILQKYFTDEQWEAILSRCDAGPGDFVLFCADKLKLVRACLGYMRSEIGDMRGLKDKDKYEFLFVTDFPEFEWSDEEGRFLAMHHPFTMPRLEDMQYLKSDPARVCAQAYDAVLNGIELGSGSIRIHDSDIQQKMFEALGFGQEEIQRRFGFLVNAFQYCTPPHGGFAFGLDRLTMLLLGEDSLREVIAFPKMRDVSCPLTDAPTAVDEAQLSILGIGAAVEHAVHGAEKAEKVDGFDPKAISRLTKLSLSAQEQITMPAEMGKIVSMVGSIQGLHYEASARADCATVMRDDKATSLFDREAMLRNAPVHTDLFITVPKTL